MLARIFGEKQDLARLVLRLIFGLIFFVYGVRHVMMGDGFTAAFANRFQIPFPEFTAPLTAWVELLGGAAAMLGLFTRYAGLLLAFTMVVSIFMVRLPQGLSEGNDILGLTGFWDLDLALFAIGIALVLMGPGKYALEWRLFSREL